MFARPPGGEARTPWFENLGLLVLCLVSIAGLVWSIALFPSGDEEDPPMRATRAAEPSRVVRFALLSLREPSEMVLRYQGLMDYLTSVTPYRFEILLQRDYGAVMEAFRRREADVALFGPQVYLEAKEHAGAVCILQPVSPEGTLFGRSYIVVREDSPIRTLSDFHGRRFAFADHKSSSGNLVPRTLLFRAGVCLEDLGGHANLRSFEEVAAAVLRGSFDGGALKDTVAGSYIGRGLRVVAESGPIPTAALCVRHDTDWQVVKALRDALLALDPARPEFRTVVRSLDPEIAQGFRNARHADFSALEDELRRIPAGCGRGCHPEEKH